jgi:hypothetical protein
MKNIYFIIIAMLIASGFSSCKKFTCTCKAYGPEGTDLNAVLNKHMDDCVEIAETGTIYDGDVAISCSY